MTSPDLATFVTGYFARHLAAERNVSAHTTRGVPRHPQAAPAIRTGSHPPIRRDPSVRGSDPGADPAISGSSPI